MRLDRFFPVQGNCDFKNRELVAQMNLCVVFREPASCGGSLTVFGGHKAVVRPDPIPNSAVKRRIADGSGCLASVRVGRRQIF